MFLEDQQEQSNSLSFGLHLQESYNFLHDDRWMGIPDCFDYGMIEEPGQSGEDNLFHAEAQSSEGDSEPKPVDPETPIKLIQCQSTVEKSEIPSKPRSKRLPKRTKKTLDKPKKSDLKLKSRSKRIKKASTSQRTSNNSIKPFFTCIKKILKQTDHQFGKFFPNFMEQSQNSVRKQYFQWFISFSEFQSISYKGDLVSLGSLLFMHRKVVEKCVRKYRERKTERWVQMAGEIEKFSELFYKALESQDYKQRMKILFQGRKVSLENLELMREKFRNFEGDSQI